MNSVVFTEILFLLSLTAAITVFFFGLFLTESLTRRVETYDILEEQLREEEYEIEGQPKSARARMSSVVNQGLARASIIRKLDIDMKAAGLNIKGSELLLIYALSVVVASIAAVLFLGVPIFLILLIPVLGWFIVRFYIGFKKNQRIELFNSQLEEAIRLMSASLKAGVSVNQAINTIAQEMQNPLKEEFTILARNIRNRSTEEALDRLRRKIPSRDLDIMVTAMIINMSIGGNLSQILDGIADTIKKRVETRERIKVNTSQARMQAIIVGVLPFFFLAVIYVINRSYMTVLFTTPLGWVLLGISAIMLVVGYFFIWRIVDIEV